jgi:hypothetical protein
VALAEVEDRPLDEEQVPRGLVGDLLQQEILVGGGETFSRVSLRAMAGSLLL